MRGDDHAIRRDKAKVYRTERLRHQIADQRGDGDRRQAARRVAADNELETVEGAGKRRAESAGDAAGGAAADQNTQIGTPQPKRHADA